MIDEIVESQPRSGWPIWLFVVVAVVVLGLILTGGSPNNWPFVCLPLGIATGIWWATERLVTFRVESESLQFERPDLTIRYADILELAAPAAQDGQAFPIAIRTAEGTTQIPPRLSVPSHELLAFLQQVRQADPNPFQVTAKMQSYVDEQLAKFGPDRVFVYRGATIMPARLTNRWVAGLVGLMVGAGVMAAAGTAVTGDPKGTFLGAAVSIAFLSGLVAVLLWIITRSPASRVNGSTALAITPMGLALEQGALRGKLRWDEILAIDHPPKRVGDRTLQGRNGIGIQVEGSDILLRDAFDKPASHIYQTLLQYWDGNES
jgi:hypothetical protein